MIVHAAALGIVFKVFDMNIYGMVFGNYVFAFLMCWLNLRAMKKYIGYEQEYKYSVVMPTLVSVAMGILTWLVYQGVYAIMASNFAALLFQSLPPLFFTLYLLSLRGFYRKMIFYLCLKDRRF